MSAGIIGLIVIAVFIVGFAALNRFEFGRFD
jgi:hypothetical protein